MRRLLHLLGGLHAKADMGDAVAKPALPVLLLHHLSLFSLSHGRMNLDGRNVLIDFLDIASANQSLQDFCLDLHQLSCIGSTTLQGFMVLWMGTRIYSVCKCLE